MADDFNFGCAALFSKNVFDVLEAVLLAFGVEKVDVDDGFEHGVFFPIGLFRLRLFFDGGNRHGQSQHKRHCDQNSRSILLSIDVVDLFSR